MSDARTVSIVPLTMAHLDDVVRIHMAGLGYTLNSLLGPSHLKFLYQTMAADPACYVGVAIWRGRPSGVVSGSLDAGNFTNRLFKTMSVRRLCGIALEMLFHPRMVWLWRQSAMIAAPVYDGKSEVKAVLTAIAVDPETRGRGIGRVLVAAFEGFLRDSGVRTYKLDTQIKNERASRFYSELGFQEAGRRADSIVFIRRLS